MNTETFVVLFGALGFWREVFPSEPSARFYLRRHGAELVAADALCLYLGKWCVHPAKFKAAIEVIAKREAARAFGINETAAPCASQSRQSA